MKAKWENEKNAIGKVQKLREEIETHQRRDREGRAELRPEARLAELKYGKLPELQERAWSRSRSRPPNKKEREFPAA